MQASFQLVGALSAITTSPILDIAILLIGVTFILMLRDKITSKLALRNISRRKATLALVVLGLFIGTGMISGSLVTSDTMNTLFTRGAFFSYGAVDEGIYHTGLSGSYSFFNYSIYDQYRPSLVSIPNVVGVTPMIISSASLFDTNTRVGQPGVVLIGVNPNSSSILGDFTDISGNVISPDLGNSGVIINDIASKDLNASVGDTLQIFAGQNSSSFVIKGIDHSFARSGFPGESDHAVITLGSAQALLGAQGQINFIALTNQGSIQQSIAYTPQVGRQANTTLASITLSGGGHLYAFGDKNAEVASQAESAQSLSSLFLVTSSFTIIAGAVLIVNIFIMLAEERKKEMGMARAVGMKRRHLTKLFLFEGMQYSLLSSLIGVAAGIGIAYAILYALGTLLVSVVPNLNIGVILDSFTITSQALVTSFSAGFLITYLTILLASWRVSKLNIIRAIRDTPDPPRAKRTYTWLLVLGVVTLVLGLLSYLGGKSQNNTTLFLVAPALAIFGIGLILSRFVKNQYAFTISSLALLVYWGYPNFSWNNPATPPIANNDFSPFIVGGIFMVVSAVILVAFNIDLISKGITMFKFRAQWLPVMKIGLSYPGNKKVRTAVTIFMFALVMFTVIAISVIVSLNNTQINQAFATSSGGYDLIAFASSPVQNLNSVVRSDSNVSSSIKSLATFNGGYVLSKDLTRTNSNSSIILYVGADPNAVGADNFFHNNQYNMTNATSSFLLPSGKVNIPMVWNDIQSNPNDVVLSSSIFGSLGPGAPSTSTILPGDKIGIRLPNGTTSTVNVIAIMNGITLSGFITTSHVIQDRLHVNASAYALMSLSSSSDANSVAISLKRDFLRFGLQVVVLPTLINQILEEQQSVFGLFQGFLGLGLVVGIAGLSIIAIRSVVERRQEIGMLRALGFTRSMVLGSFLLENSFVAILGIVIGALLAVDLGFAIANSGPVSTPYIVPWVSIVEICVTVYIFAILGTAWSALRASRIPPAQALKYIE